MNQDILALVECNLKTLHNLHDGLQTFDDQVYVAQPKIKASPVGMHVRHVIEFYQEFVRAKSNYFQNGLCYDNRKRNLQLETSRQEALTSTETLIAQFETEAFSEQTIALQSIVDPESPKIEISSTVSRELFYLVDHAIHHMAIIKMIAETHNLSFDETFGVANSTQQERLQKASQ
ncbi:MAG: hypothetical protein GC137_03510 [Alphaproteobacteria bacterium]|nr:hypothetical protein [Alphaproteobacteria bacterium]